MVAADGGGRDREQLIGGRLLDLGQLLGGERLEVPVVLVLTGRLVVLTRPVQPVLAFRVAVQPGEILVPPGVLGNRRQEHEPRPFGRRIVLSNIIA
jgi:hypothetical protein